jgi:hypothetical protein
VPGDPEVVPPLDENDAVPGTGAHGTRARRPVVAGILLGLLLVAAGTGVYALVQNLKTSSTVTALDNLCNSVGYAVQLAYDHKGNLETFHKMVDRDAAAAGGRALSDTTRFELAVRDSQALSAEKDLAQLAAICDSNGSPISTPVTS